jgi:NAD(P)-dependent dehydrogenase (short-subunit alcohol dehydrogenase family)
LIADVKIAVVTGGAHGIGRALCERLAKDGVKVVVADLDEDAAKIVAADIDGVSFKVDVGDEAGMTAMIESVEESVGPIDIFFSNAGLVFGDGKSGAASADGVLAPVDDRWDISWRVNVMAHVYAARVLVPRMIKRGGGYIVSTTSAAGLLSSIGDAAYSVTKHAAVGFAEALAIRLGVEGI